MTPDGPAPLDRKPPPPGPPTRVRYGVLAFLCALAFVLYIDRNAISKAAPQMEADLGLSHTMMGFVFGAFTVAYGLFEVPTGHWGDRYGSRRVLIRIVLWWSLFTTLTGCVWAFRLDSGRQLFPGTPFAVPLVLNSFGLLLLVRFLFGAGEAGALPNVARVVSRWFPPHARGPAQGLINTAMLIGGAVTPVAAAYLIHLVGWRGAFALFGTLGVAWVLPFALWFRDDPAEHPAVNDGERRLIGAGGPVAPEEHPRVPWRRVLASREVWLLGTVIACMAFFTYLYYSWYPTYLEKGRGLGPIASGWLASLVLAGGAVGATAGGYLGDWVVRRTGSRRWARPLIGAGGLSLAAAFLVAGIPCESALASSLWMSLAFFAAAGTIASWWAVVMDVSGRHVGALFGLMNSMGIPGTLGAQLFFGSFADWREAQGYSGRERWDPAFYFFAVGLLLGAIAWLFINPTRSAVAPAEKEAGGESAAVTRA
jgi:MFS family permease